MLCAFVLYQMCSYLLLISMSNTVRDILSRLGRWIQVLSALNSVDALESKVKHAQCFDVALMRDGSIVLASKDYRLYIYRYVKVM